MCVGERDGGYENKFHMKYEYSLNSKFQIRMNLLETMKSWFLHTGALLINFETGGEKKSAAIDNKGTYDNMRTNAREIRDTEKPTTTHNKKKPTKIGKIYGWRKEREMVEATKKCYSNFPLFRCWLCNVPVSYQFNSCQWWPEIMNFVFDKLRRITHMNTLEPTARLCSFYIRRINVINEDSWKLKQRNGSCRMCGLFSGGFCCCWDMLICSAWKLRTHNLLKWPLDWSMEFQFSRHKPYDSS